jgi:hypothetical protein
LTQEQAGALIKMYALEARKRKLPGVISDIDFRYGKLQSPSEDKTMRWLGFCQGFMVCAGVFSLEDVKNHSVQAQLA